MSLNLDNFNPCTREDPVRHKRRVPLVVSQLARKERHARVGAWAAALGKGAWVYYEDTLDALLVLVTVYQLIQSKVKR